MEQDTENSLFDIPIDENSKRAFAKDLFVDDVNRCNCCDRLCCCYHKGPHVENPRYTK